MQIKFTMAAINKIKEVISDEPDADKLALRIFIQGGGCSGFQYGFTLDENVNEDDYVLTTEGVKIVVDAASHQLLAGAKVDYKKELMSEQFIITNPNATSTCGCGSSFTAD